MRYRSHKDRLRLTYAAALGFAALLTAIAALGASPALETCTAHHSADTCRYALR